MNIRSKIEAVFFKQVNIAPLIGFRIIFGVLMLFGVLRFISKGWVYDLYIRPTFHFTYLGFDWVKPLPDVWMYLPFILMVVGSVGIILGLFYRLSSTLFFICFSYVELLDKSYYLNHYYFVSLVAFLLIFLPANRDFSIDVKRKPELFSSHISAWHIWIIRVQLGVVYFFAGLAKINSDWLLEAQPLRIWLQAFRDTPWIGGLFASSLIAYFFSWFGCLYDLSIPFFLSNKRTRNIAYLFVIIFHLVTWILFPIGVFPWVMIFSTLIFFPAGFHQSYLKILKALWNWTPPTPSRRKIHKRFTSIQLVGIYLVFQLIIPFRYLYYPPGLFWHEEGFRFSWRVMLMHKEGLATFYVQDPKNGRTIEVDNTKFLSEVQIDQMSTQADMIIQYARHLKNSFKDTIFHFHEQVYQLKNPSVHAEVFVSLNGRPSRLFVDKKHDLSKLDYNLAHRTWIEPFYSNK